MITTANDINHHNKASFSKKDFETLYLELRKKEKRIYTDEQVAVLPLIDVSNVYFNEWQLRKRSAERLFRYLQNKNKPLTILEVGCGNGWLLAKMASIKNTSGTGIDINNHELEQAGRVFGNRKNLSFLNAGLMNGNLDNMKFDIIIFAASIQYFPSPQEIITRSLSLLNKAGEIHIMDSHFYANDEIPKAANRTFSYYRSLGYEEMTKHYFHHSMDSLNMFNPTLMFDPSVTINKLFRKKDIFPWIRILK